MIGAVIVSIFSQASEAGEPSAIQKGINANELFLLDSNELQARVADYKNLGVQWVRFDFDWSVIQPSPQEYRIENYDRVVKSLQVADIKVIGLIAYTPSWANGGQASKFFPPTNPRTFARFAAYLAKRYSSMGVATWEIWNEPNLGQFWGPVPDPRAYAALLRRTYPAMKAANPSALIVSGGLAQPVSTTHQMDAVYFLELLYASGAKPYFDAVGNHPYTSPQAPLEGINSWSRMQVTASSLRSVMSQYGDQDKKIWVTEYGAPTGGVDPFHTQVSEARQAELVSRVYQAAKQYDWMGPVFWYNYRDFCAYDQHSGSECFYGITRLDGSRKPAYEAYRNAR